MDAVTVLGKEESQGILRKQGKRKKEKNVFLDGTAANLLFAIYYCPCFRRDDNIIGFLRGSLCLCGESKTVKSV
jgi:hypothetical protein